MLKAYYHVKHDNNHYIVSYQDENGDSGMLLLKNGEIIDRTKGLLGEFELKGQNIIAKLKNTMTKSTVSLSVDNQEVKMESISKKNLKNKLNNDRIYNYINPSPDEIETNRVKMVDIKLPLILLSIGFFMPLLLKDQTSLIQKIGLLPTAIGAWMVYQYVRPKFKWLGTINTRQESKQRLGFVALTVIITGVFWEIILKYM